MCSLLVLTLPRPAVSVAAGDPPGLKPVEMPEGSAGAPAAVQTVVAMTTAPASPPVEDEPVVRPRRKRTASRAALKGNDEVKRSVAKPPEGEGVASARLP